MVPEHFASLLALTFALGASGPVASVPPVTPPTVKVAAVQCSSELGNVAANTKKLTELVKEAATVGAAAIEQGRSAKAACSTQSRVGSMRKCQQFCLVALHLLL